MCDDKYLPIDCGIHDQLELACMRGLPVKLTTEREILLGKPLTTRTSPDHAEWLIISLAGGDREIRLDRILSIEPLDPGAGGSRIDFTQP